NNQNLTEFQVLIQSMTQLTNALATGGAVNINHNGLNHPKIAVKIPTYKGEAKENVAAWLLQCQSIFQAQNLTDNQIRINYASTGLEGAALHWYLNKVSAAGANNAFASWDDFEREVKAAFQPPNYQHHLRQQLKRLKQTGSVQEYGAQFRNIMGQIDNMAEIDKVTYFLEGLKPATRMEVAYQAPDTFENAWALAIRFDTAMFGSNRFNPNRSQSQQRFNSKPQKPSFNSGPVPMEIDYVGTSSFHHNSNSNNNSNRQKGKFNGSCYKCGLQGHIAKNCRVKRKTNLSNVEDDQQQTQQQNILQNSLELTQVEENKEQLLRFNGNVNGHKAWILLDSGASRNFIDENFVAKINLPTKNISPLSVELADGRKSEITKAANIRKL